MVKAIGSILIRMISIELLISGTLALIKLIEKDDSNFYVVIYSSLTLALGVRLWIYSLCMRNKHLLNKYVKIIVYTVTVLAISSLAITQYGDTISEVKFHRYLHSKQGEFERALIYVHTFTLPTFICQDKIGLYDIVNFNVVLVFTSIISLI